MLVVAATRKARLFALAVGGALALAGAAWGGEADAAASAALIERIAAAHRNVVSIQGRASWRTRHRDEPASEARLQLVQFALLFPDHYRVAITKPGDDDWREVYLSDGVRCEKREYLFQGEAPTSRVTAVGADDAEIPRLLTRLVSCFRLDLPALSADLTVTAVAVEVGTRVTLTPRQAPLADQLTAITVELDAAMEVTRFSCADPQGNRYEVTIDQAEYDKPIAPATFQVAAAGTPPGQGK
jgi:hypothetical protein